MNRTLRPALLALLAIGCTEYSYTSKYRKDVFQQRRMNTVDILLVVDNSCSMVEEQDKLATNFQSFIAAFEGAEVDYQIGVTTTDTLDEDQSGRLVGGDDEIVLTDADGRTIDEVSWDRDWPVQTGVALQLDADHVADSDNATEHSWCAATETYGDGDYGTPGGANTSCDARRPAPPEATPPRSAAASAPSAGDVVISEFMATPSKVADSFGEWVELTNTTDHDVDLSGCGLSDYGRNAYTFPDGTTIAAGGRLVAARSDDSSWNGGVSADVALGEDFTINNADSYLTPDTPDAEAIFAENVAVGITGSGIEMGLEAARLALDEDLLSTDNAGFIRDEANLSLIFVSDEEDSSPDSAWDYLRFYSDVKGDAAYRDHGIVNVSAVVGRDEPPYDGAPSCESSSGSAAYGSRYLALAVDTEGATESICDDDFSPIATELGLTASGLSLTFVLGEPADPRDLTVSLYSSPDEASFIEELVVDQDYTFDAGQNAIVFDARHIPPSETFIMVEYRVLANGAAVSEESP